MARFTTGSEAYNIVWKVLVMEKAISRDLDVDADVLAEVILSLKRLPPEKRERVIETVATFFGVGASTKSRDIGANAGPFLFSKDRTPSPKQFLTDKGPRNGHDRIMCLAYYLTHYRNLPTFSVLDISKLNAEAAQSKLPPPEIHFYIHKALAKGLLLGGGPIRKEVLQLTTSGEKFVRELDPSTKQDKSVEKS